MIRGLWTQDTLGWLLTAALLPVAAVAIVTGGVWSAIVGATTLAAGAFWQIVFRHTIGTPFSPSAAVTATAIVVLGPVDIELWQAALAASFGLVIADLVFGGWGRNVVPAPVAALAFLFLSFPNALPGTPDVMVAYASGLAALLLLLVGLLDLRVIVGFAVAGAVLLVSLDAPVVVTGAVAFGVVFLVADPVTTGSTGAGKWLHGILAGALTALIAAGGPGLESARPVVFAALLAAIFVPLADYVAIELHKARRLRRHG